MAHEQQRRAGSGALGVEEREKVVARVRIERGGRFVGDEQFRPADEAARQGDALLLTHRQFRDVARTPRGGVETQRFQKARSLGERATRQAGRARRATRREAQRQQHIVENGEIGEQIEELKHEADVIGAQTIAARAAGEGEILAEEFDAAGSWRQDTGDEIQQRALAAAAGALQEHTLAAADPQLLDGEQVTISARPAKAQVLDGEHRSVAGIERCVCGHGGRRLAGRALHYNGSCPSEAVDSMRMKEEHPMRSRSVLRRLLAALGLAALLSAQHAGAFEIAGVAIAEGARTDLRIEVPAGDEDPATFVPVSVLRGVAPGPTLLLVAGVHGFEFHSILAVERLAETLDPDMLAGTLILVRVAHVPAFEERSPYVNPSDRRNLNRAFPGAADGSQTERIAHVLSTQLIARADFVADLHSGDGAEWLDAFVGIYGGPLASGYEDALAFGRAMGFPNLVRYSMRDQAAIDRGRSLNRQAVAQGLPTVLVEIGENGQRDPAKIDTLVRGLRAGMASLGMLDEALPDAAPARHFEGEVSVPVEHSGIWHPDRTVGGFVAQGERLGIIRDYAGRTVETVRAPIAGYALYGLAGPPVRAGDSVMAITRPVDSLD